ncbi:MAG: FG-GAP-like repeat-containing protein, partial [Acidobacteriota bacterium]
MSRGISLLGQERTAEAQDVFDQCLAINPDAAELHFQLARLHMTDFHRSADREKAQPFLEKAEGALDRALRLNANHEGAAALRFEIASRPTWFRYAPDLAYQMALRISRNAPAAFQRRLELARWMAGEVRFHSADPKRVPLDSSVGLKRALLELESLLRVVPPYSAEEQTAFFEIGRVLAKQGQLERALPFFGKRLQRISSPRAQAQTWREIGLSLFRLGRFEEAAKAFVNALSAWGAPADQWLLHLSQQKSAHPIEGLPEQFRFPVRPELSPAQGGERLQFVDIAGRLGVDRLDGNGPSSWGDFDGDGRADLLLAGSDAFIGLYRNQKDRFVEVTSAAGLEGIASGYSANVVDYDNDGHLDIYLSLNGWSGPAPNRLFRNLGGGAFEEVTDQSGTGDPGSGFVSLWGDLDNDGDLDLAVANGVLKDGSTPQLYENQGDGTFRNVTREAGISEPPDYGAIGIALGDYDRDGDLDLFVNGWVSSPNRLYRNDGNLRFSQVAEQAGVVQPPHRGFVCFFFDYNNDAYPDILTTSQAPWGAVLQGLAEPYSVSGLGRAHPDASRLFRNNRDGTFTDVTLQAGLHYPLGTMAAGVADLDNDGHLDLYFGTGDPSLSRLEPNRFFRNRGDGTFADQTFSAGLGNIGKGHGITFCDF